MDIIFFAALTLYIFFRLKNQLGRVDEEQKREAIKKFLKQQADIVDSDNSATKNAKKNPNLIVVDSDSDSQENQKNLQNTKILSKSPSQNKAQIAQVLSRSKVTADEFISGAEKAFEIVIKSFCDNDKKTLELLLEKGLYDKFSKAIDDRKKSGQKLVNNIISLDDAIIVSSNLKKNIAQFLVEFCSKQISYVTDKNDKIIQGSSNNIVSNNDIWTFERDIKSPNPNWVIISTKS